MSVTITNIEKIGPVIICSTNDSKNRSYKIDFKEGKVYGLSGNTLTSTRSIVNKISRELAEESPFYPAIKLFVQNSNRYNTLYYSIIESFLSYPDLFRQSVNMRMIDYIIDNCNGKLPKGYVTWCRKNNEEFSKFSLNLFYANQKMSNWPQSLVDTIKKFTVGTGLDIALYTKYDKELCTSLMRIVNNSLKRYEFRDLIMNISDIIYTLRENPQFRQSLDDTKSAKVTIQILREAINKERNDRILANEARFSSLNNTEIDGLIIKVPSTMDDFTKEGEQQHNCVGYYYHDRIANGNTFIYFLRRAVNPDRSYITCRFSLDDMKTVEYREKYNRNYNDYNDLFKTIDKMIKSILENQ